MKMYRHGLLSLSVMLIGMAAFAQATPADGNAPVTQAQLERMQNEIDTLKSQVNEPEGALQTSVADINKLKKITFSGYAQLRLESNRGATNTVRNDQRFNFSQRRVRLKVVGRPIDTTQVTYSFDLGNNGFTTKDAYIDYFVKGDPAFGFTGSIGQFAIPFGYQNTQSSSAMEAPERAKVIRTFFPDEYDRGIKITSPTDYRIVGDLAVVQGTGQNATDNTQNKDVVGRLRMKVLPQLDGGLSAYVGGKTVVGNTIFSTKNRYGADFQLYLNQMSIKGEYIRAVRDQGISKSGYYLLTSYNVTKNDVLVAMYDVLKDAGTRGDQTAYTVGINHYLDSATRLRLFYEINDEQRNKISNNTLRLEVLSTF